MTNQNEEILERGGCIIRIPIVKEMIPSRLSKISLLLITPFTPLILMGMFREESLC